ncbi:MAG: amidohydrolase family protein, partial [Myxococcota bacterium]|nr:amidohydrolase family protein [Myxococcota bacterium]
AAAEFAGIGLTLLPVAYQRNSHDRPINHPQKRFIHEDVSDYVELLDRVREHNDHLARRPVQVGIAAHSVRALDKDYLGALGGLGEAGGYRCHAHVAEQPEEIRSCVAEHRMRPLEVLAEAGLLSDRFTAVHATHLSENEIRLLGSSGSSACICPTTERNLGDGLPKLTELLEAGCALSIGSDSQVRIDPFAEIRALEDGERLRTLSRSVLTNDEGAVAPVLIDAGTRGGRSATGLALGGIEVGQRADLVGVDLDNAHLEGINLGSEGQDAVLAALVLGGHASQVCDAWVGGRHIISEGRHLRWEAAQQGYTAVARRVWA